MRKKKMKGKIKRRKSGTKIEMDWRVGNTFDIFIEKGYSYRDGTAASFTGSGGIVFYTSQYWPLMNLTDILGIINHELDHILIGQLVGVKASNAYDEFMGHLFFPTHSEPFISDLWKRKK